MSAVLAAARLLAEEGATETPHSWWPEPYEMIWGTLATALVVAALWKLAIPQLRKALAARTARIQRELDASAAALADSRAAAEQVRASKGDLGAERSRLLAEADGTAERVLSEGRQRIQAEVAQAHTKAAADTELARGRVSAELHADVARIAGDAAENIVHGSLDDATHQRLIEDFIAKVGAGR